MTTGISAPDTLRGVLNETVTRRVDGFRSAAMAFGLGASILYIVVGLRFDLQTYADGSIFSYAIAVRDAWDFHWHNISGRVFVYLFCHVPAQIYVGLTDDANGGIALYGFLFFGAQLFGLLATFALDRSRDRVIFCFACLSVACLCPLVFGYPTEMWMTHALFWPALAACHSDRRGLTGFAIAAASLTALVLTHEAGVVFAAAIAGTLVLRGLRDALLWRGALALVVALSVWAAVKAVFPPDDYFASILSALATNAIDPSSLANAVVILLLGTLAAYALTSAALRRLTPQADAFSVAIVAGALAVYWLLFDDLLHAEARYYLRTALLIATPALGALAAWRALEAHGQLNPPFAFLPRLMALIPQIPARAATGAILLVLLVHGVETAKFALAWTAYRDAVRDLAMGTASDAYLGDPRFVSSARIAADLNRLSWSSTTPYLSILVTPSLAPRRLVVDPEPGYVWTSCETATASEQAARAIPAESRRLIARYACLHR